MKLSLSYMLAKYFKFRMSFKLRVRKFITILKVFQVENERTITNSRVMGYFPR